MGLKEVVPGLLVSDKFTVSIPHPDPCWVMESENGSDVIVSDSRKLLGFTTKESLLSFMKVANVPGTVVSPISYTWDNLVEKYGSQYSYVLIDHQGQAGFYQTVPLRKEI